MNTNELVLCSECGEFHNENFCHHLADGRWVCNPCALEAGGVTVCKKCGRVFRADEDMNETADGDRVCDDCLDKFYLQCDRCGEYFLEADLTRTTNGEDVCDDCLERHYTKCDGCGEYVPDEDRYEVDDSYFCDDCFNNTDYVRVCEDCGDSHLPDNMHDVGGSYEYRWVCDDCFEHYYQCDACEEWFHEDSEEWKNGNEGYCESCWNERQEEEDDEPNRIHEYHWGHSGWFDGPHYLPEECPDRTLTYGVEIEMAEGSFDEDMTDGDLMYHFEHDGSLSGGDACELITQPCSLAYHREEFGWAGILQRCIDNGYVSHNAKCSCGFHVHIGRKCLSDLDEMKLDVWFNRYAEYWKHIARRNSSSWGAMNKDKALAECCKARHGNNDHGVAVNHGNSRTVEIRVARGTLRVETVLGTLEAYDGVIHYLRRVGCLDLYNHLDKAWQGFLKYLSTKPREYGNAIRMIDRLHSYKVTKDAVVLLEERKARKENWGKQKKEGK